MNIKITHPDIAAQAHNWDPTIVSAGSNQKKEWICIKGHIWKTTVNSRTSGTGCPYCFGLKPIVGETDLNTTHPDIAAQAYNWSPKTISYGSDKEKMQWKCNENHIWMATVNSRTNMKSGCPYCAYDGFKLNLISFVYLIWKLGKYKIGIYNINSGRIEIHNRKGWTLIEEFKTNDGYTAKQIEKTIIQQLDNNKILRGKKAFRKKFYGWTESWQEVDLQVINMIDLFKKLNMVHLIPQEVLIQLQPNTSKLSSI
jgi:hypothetical protein